MNRGGDGELRDGQIQPTRPAGAVDRPRAWNPSEWQRNTTLSYPRSRPQAAVRGRGGWYAQELSKHMLPTLDGTGSGLHVHVFRHTIVQHQQALSFGESVSVNKSLDGCVEEVRILCVRY